MTLEIEIIPYCLGFKRPAKTSRGVYWQHQVYYVLLSNAENQQQWGIGEAAPLPDLSYDALPSESYLTVLKQACRDLQCTQTLNYEALRSYPSIYFALETAWHHYQQHNFAFWSNAFSLGYSGITINGLVWMDSYYGMQQQVAAKIAQGFRCIKLKIGALEFSEELKLLRWIRQHYSASEIELRVDANGAFTPQDVFKKLQYLSEFQLHSIEQPISCGQYATMAEVVKVSPIAIALDEELIGCVQFTQKQQLLETIRPHYLVLKPSLHGGLKGCEEWIELAKRYNIKWWLTSALESNIGLNSIAQWCAQHQSVLPQGLGTGLLYQNNIPSGLVIEKDKLWYRATQMPTKPQLLRILIKERNKE